MMDKNLQTNWWAQTPEQIGKILGTNIANGLSTQEAISRKKKIGKNILPQKKEFTVLSVFIRQLSHTFVFVLLASLIIAYLMGQFIDTVAIAAILILNVFIGFIQEYSAERSLQSLQKIISPKANVIRDGINQSIMAQELVPGDIVILNAGQLVPADGRIIEQNNLATQEAALTGESQTINKTTQTLPEQNLPIGERTNMIFMGTNVVRGNGRIIVTQTGPRTELGIIAKLITEEKGKTHLEDKIEHLTRMLLIICIIIIIIVFIIYLLRHISLSESILAGLSIAVAAIPEGLPSVMIIALSIGVQRMVRVHTIVRRLSAIETIGAVTVICADKTGTLTKNEMSVTNIWIADQIIHVKSENTSASFIIDDEKEIEINQFPALIELLKIASLCNNAFIEWKNNELITRGDPTELALLAVSMKAGFDKKELAKQFPLIQDRPFDSGRKRASSIRYYNNKKVIFTQGAPEIILNLSIKILVGKDIVPLIDEYKIKINNVLKKFAQNALRVIGVAFKYINSDDDLQAADENEFIFVGLLGLIDPPRPEAKKAIGECKNAGIRVIMITGDYADTAVAIAKQLEINNQLNILTGTEFDKMSDQEFKKQVKNFSVYSRISPEQKIRIVRAWQSEGEIVAMTGDGINDAPAIKAADIGIAMGITGTEVTKEAADIIITDDNFASIAQAVALGRGILDNIIKFIHYLLSHNIVELLIILVAIAIGFTDPNGKIYVALLPVQLLWLNLITDGIMAIALAFDPVSSNIMKRPPRDPQEPLVSLNTLSHFFIIGMICTVAILLMSYIGLQKSAEVGHSITLTSLILIALNLIYFVRSHYGLGFFSNKWILFAFLFSLILQLTILYVPSLRQIFKLAPLAFQDWIITLSLSLLLLPILKLVKNFFNEGNENS